MPDEPQRERTAQELLAEVQRLIASGAERRARQSEILAEIEEVLERSRQTGEKVLEQRDRTATRRLENEQRRGG